jgi:hypothetical protein
MDSKTYVFGENGNQNFDPNLLFGMMMGGGGFGGFGGGNWLWPLLLFALWGNNGFGFGGFGGNRGGCGNAAGFGFLSDQLNNDAGRALIMQAIQGNDNAISQLASTLNCNINELRTALNNISGKICDVANSVGMSSMQVIQAINAGDTALQSKLCDCCCSIKAAIQESNYLTERGFCSTNQNITKGFSDLGYATRDQTCAIEKAIANSTSQILEGQRAAEMRDMQDKLDALREKNAQQAVILNNTQQTAQFAAMLAPIQSDLADLKCNQVPVKKIACPETYVPVNNSINATYGLIPTCGYGFGLGYGGWNSGCNTFNWG